MGRRQIVFSRHHRPVGTVRTACPRHPGFHRRLPAMPLPAAPPEGLVAAVGEGDKRYTGVLFRVKLLEQGFFTLGHTIIIKALFHWHHLPNKRSGPQRVLRPALVTCLMAVSISKCSADRFHTSESLKRIGSDYSFRLLLPNKVHSNLITLVVRASICQLDPVECIADCHVEITVRRVHARRVRASVVVSGVVTC